MIVDAHLSCHSLNIEIVGADERECPPLFLHLVNERLYHFEVILLRAVLLAVGDDCHQDVVALGGLSVELGDGSADGIVERCATAGIVILATETVYRLCLNIVIFECLMSAVEGEQRYALFHILVHFLHLLHCVNRLVHTGKSLTLDYAHRTALIHDNHIEYSFHNSFLLFL